MGYLKTASCHAEKIRGVSPNFCSISPFCPRDFYVSRADKHSDLTRERFAPRVTVMAVAADFHRDFLIPESTVLQYSRSSSASNGLRYSFVDLLYNKITGFARGTGNSIKLYPLQRQTYVFAFRRMRNCTPSPSRWYCEARCITIDGVPPLPEMGCSGG